MKDNIDMKRLEELITLALEEDLGPAGADVTSDNVFSGEKAQAAIIARQDLVVCGTDVIHALYSRIDKKINADILKEDGSFVKKGTVIAKVSGKAASVMKGERIVLNFLQRMCGVATMTRDYVKALGDKVKLLDTRKTLPGYRMLDKYAVKCGGGVNHRMGLYDMVMIKDNHKEVCGGVVNALRSIRKNLKDYRIEVEADTLDEVKAAAAEGCDVIMLDNMDNAAVEVAAREIRRLDPSIKIEVSGGITIERLISLGKLDIDYVSTGAITHSAPAADLAMDIIIGA